MNRYRSGDFLLENLKGIKNSGYQNSYTAEYHRYDATTGKTNFHGGRSRKILGLGRQTAYELARRGELPGIKRLGGRFIVSRIQLEEYLGKNQEEG